MKPVRKLQLRKESLSELTTYDLLSVAGGSAASVARAMTCCYCDPVGDVKRALSPWVQTSGGTQDIDCTTKEQCGNLIIR